MESEVSLRFSKSSVRVIVAAIAGLAVVWWFRLWTLVVAAGMIVWQVKAIRHARKSNQELTTSVRIFLGILNGGLFGVGVGVLQGWLHYPASDMDREIVAHWWLGRTIVCSVFSANCGILIGMLLAVAPREIRYASIVSAVSGACMGLLISHVVRSSIPVVEMLTGCVYSVLCAVVGVGLVMWCGGVSRAQPMLRCGQWILSTLQLASLLLGGAFLLLTIAAPLAEVLNERYRVDDDWSILAMPAGAIVGLSIGVKYRNRRWLHRLASVTLVLLLGFAIFLSIPRQAPESMLEGMNRLPIALGNFLRVTLLYVLIISASISCVVAAVTNVVLQSSRPELSSRQNDDSLDLPH